MKATIKDFITVSSGILLSKKIVSFCFYYKLIIDKTHMKNVVF